MQGLSFLPTHHFWKTKTRINSWGPMQGERGGWEEPNTKQDKGLK